MPSNQYGWNCRTHYQYEDNQPAVDWYLPTGTPVIATMDATAELYIITTKNSFTYYNYPTNLYLGLPPANAPGYPFSGPSGGMGVFISLVAEGIPVRAEYGHLDPSRTIAHVPENAFVPPYSRTYNYDAAFGTMKGPRDFTLIARWPVKRGQVIGYVGNSGYSDVPHLHYQIITPDRNTKYCPSEENFPRSGWLFRRPL
jgi:hypothetical protein